VLARDIGDVYIRPASPRLNGKVERSHRIDQDDFYRMLEGVGIVPDHLGLSPRRFRPPEWVAGSRAEVDTRGVNSLGAKTRPA
jgi:hypothetical protein